MAYFIVLNCIFVFSILAFFQMYRRTGLKSHLFISLGGAIAFVGVIGTFGFMHIGYELWSDLFFNLFLIPGGILGLIGFVLLYTIESGAARESTSGRSISDMIFGNISTIEQGKKYKPALGRNIGMLLGFMITVGGIAQWFDSYPRIFSYGLYLIIFGLAIFVISLIALDGKCEEKEETEIATTLEWVKIQSARGRIAGIVLGFVVIIGGVYKCYNSYPPISYSGIFLIVIGLAAFVAVLVASKRKE